MSTRSSNAEIEFRIQDLLNLRIQGWSYADIADHCKAKWGVTSSRTVSKYMKDVNARMARENEAGLEERRAEQIIRYKEILKHLSPRLYRQVPVLDKDGKQVKEKGKLLFEEQENENAIRLYLMTCRRLDRISGTESVTHKLEGLVNFKTADVNLTEKDQKEYDAALAAFFGGKAPKN